MARPDRFLQIADKAQAALISLASLEPPSEESIHIQADAGGRHISAEVPRDAFDLLIEVLRHLANGARPTIVPVHGELTTQEAADLLNVSRPYLVRLLDTGKIPFRMVGAHRRVRMVDIHAYQKGVDVEQKKLLSELAAEAEKHGLGY